jgi:hypothetical protein
LALPSNLYFTVRASGKRRRDRLSDESVNVSNGRATPDIEPPEQPGKNE